MSFISLSVSLSSLANPEFSPEHTEKHLDALAIMGLNKTESQLRDLDLQLAELRKLENYSQSLSQYFLNAIEKNSLAPYTLNLIPALLKAVTRVHSNIRSLPQTREGQMLLALQLESFRKVHDLFLHKKSLRSVIQDQIQANQIHDFTRLKDSTLSRNYIESLEGALKKNSFPIESRDVEKSMYPSVVQSWSQSGLYRLMERSKSWSCLADTEMFWRNVGDGLLAGIGKVSTGASAAFGAVAGNIAWREGYLKEDQDLYNRLEQTLLPFDLLMEKKAYKFTDITIPGHWGHVGVYLGTEAQLRELGLWDHPAIEPFKEGILSGKSIFQVRRWGLEFDSLKNFLNLDEMAVLRIEDFTKKNIDSLSKTLNFLSDQMGKGYDFSFDAMTGETITCTEIVAFSYGPIKWPMKELLGRLTISPNDLAELAFYENSPMKTKMYITGDESGTHYKSVEDFGKTLNFVKRNGRYQLYSEVCQRTRYRHRSGGMRFTYSCEDVFTTKTY